MKLIRLIKYSNLALIRIYKDTMVKSKDYNVKLYSNLHQNFQVQTLKNYKYLHENL